MIHSYRHRLGLAPGCPAHEEIERKPAALPAIGVSAVTLDGDAEGVVPATDGTGQASRFRGPRLRRVVAGAGHDQREEAPGAFADAVWEWAVGRAERVRCRCARAAQPVGLATAAASGFVLLKLGIREGRSWR